MAGKDKVPNEILRRVRVQERHETRAEFAESLARKAHELGELLVPSERYIARLEDGEIRFPHAAYRRALAELCGRPVSELGFIARVTARNTLPSRRLDTLTSYDVMKAADDIQPPLRLDVSSGISANRPSGNRYYWPDWFGIKLAQLIALIDRWQINDTEINALQAVLAQEVLMFDTSAPRPDDPLYGVYATSRRQALMTVAAMPLAFATNVVSSDSRSLSAARESFLTQCAASITVCWYLLRGNDLDTVDELMSSYLVPLEGIARQNSKHQRAGAVLASQTHRIRGIVALHRDQIGMREYHCKQAYHYATVACDTASQASALVSLASTYFYSSRPEQAASVYERALSLEDQLSLLQRSRIHAELSVVYGQLEKVDQAIRSAEVAGQLYPGNPEADPSYLYADFTPASLALEQGLAFLALAEHHDSSGYQYKAAETLRLMDQSESLDVPHRIRFEIVNHLAYTSVLLGDAEAFEAYIHRGIDGARMLGSRQREKEARTAIRRAIQKWPNERRIRRISEALQITASEVTEY